jgi:hypothetical protein
MHRRLARTCTTAGLALLFPLALAPLSASADPAADSTPFELTCGNETYSVVTAGNGEWTPAHDTESNLVFVPHAFGPFHGEVRDAAGQVVDSFDEPGARQGKGKQPNDVSCVYTFEEVSDGSDPEFPAGYSFHGSGTVTGQIAGHS